MVLTIRSALMALPGRLAMNLVNIPTVPEVSQIIREEVILTLNELARHEYDPKVYAKRVKDRMAWDAEQQDDEE